MKQALIVIGVWVAFSMLNDWLLIDEIEKIKQDIIEIKKDYSYDPRDAK